MPILSFPGIQITGHTVEEMVRDGHLQAVCMEAIALAEGADIDLWGVGHEKSPNSMHMTLAYVEACHTYKK